MPIRRDVHRSQRLLSYRVYSIHTESITFGIVYHQTRVNCCQLNSPSIHTAVRTFGAGNQHCTVSVSVRGHPRRRTHTNDRLFGDAAPAIQGLPLCSRIYSCHITCQSMPPFCPAPPCILRPSRHRCQTEADAIDEFFDACDIKPVSSVQASSPSPSPLARSRSISSAATISSKVTCEACGADVWLSDVDNAISAVGGRPSCHTFPSLSVSYVSKNSSISSASGTYGKMVSGC